ncbi:MAG: diaminopimelate decarboxylase, partial [Oscillospiraceae bacterium]|nr:diaminopimelate decarboxylase [Oscillospiraceae bacterium]
MFVSDCLGVNAAGHLTIDGKDTLELAGEYGTPLYVMSETQIRENCRKFRHSFEEHYDGNGMALYASKAFCCKAICRIAQEEGMGLDVVSAGELYTAASVGFPAERIYFHGNNKTPEELVEALRYGVGTIVVDNVTELEVLDQLAASMGKTAEIMFRVKPGVDAHTHDFIRTGQIDSKFGVALETGEAMAAVRRAAELAHVRLVGLHCHIGSQIFDIAPFEEAARVMLGFLAEVQKVAGAGVNRLNLGGGFGIKYIPENDPAGLETYMARVSAAVHQICGELGIPVPFILIEPGRSIVGDAGITL